MRFKFTKSSDFSVGVILFIAAIAIVAIELYVIKRINAKQASATFLSPSGITINPSAANLVGGIKKLEQQCKSAYGSNQTKVQKCIDDGLSRRGGSGGSSSLTGRIPETASQQ